MEYLKTYCIPPFSSYYKNGTYHVAEDWELATWHCEYGCSSWLALVLGSNGVVFANGCLAYCQGVTRYWPLVIESYCKCESYTGVFQTKGPTWVSGRCEDNTGVHQTRGPHKGLICRGPHDAKW